MTLSAGGSAKTQGDGNKTRTRIAAASNGFFTSFAAFYVGIIPKQPRESAGVTTS
jgi:hypothetical protein